MNKRQAKLHVLDFILVDVPVPSIDGFYEDPATGEAFSDQDQKRLSDAWHEVYWLLAKRASHLAKSLKVERRRI